MADGIISKREYEACFGKGTFDLWDLDDDGGIVKGEWKYIWNCKVGNIPQRRPSTKVTILRKEKETNNSGDTANPNNYVFNGDDPNCEDEPTAAGIRRLNLPENGRFKLAPIDNRGRSSGKSSANTSGKNSRRGSRKNSPRGSRRNSRSRSPNTSGNTSNRGVVSLFDGGTTNSVSRKVAAGA